MFCPYYVSLNHYLPPDSDKIFYRRVSERRDTYSKLRNVLDFIVIVLYSPSVFVCEYMDYHFQWAYLYIFVLITPPLLLSYLPPLLAANVLAILVSYLLALNYLGPETYYCFKPATASTLSMIVPLLFLLVQSGIFLVLSTIKILTAKLKDRSK